MKRILFLLFLLSFLFISVENISAQAWNAIGNGINGRVASFAIYKGDLYVGGQFYNSNGTGPFGLLKLNGNSFDTLPGNYLFGSFAINTLVVYKNELYAGGQFCKGCKPVGSTFDNIAKWNGTSWNSVGNGVGDGVSAMTVYNGNLYVAGGFLNIENLITREIAKWDGNQWSQLAGHGVDDNGGIKAFEVYNNELYAGGGFNSINSNFSLKDIARWNDTIWNKVDSSGIDQEVSALGIFKNELYACGSYITRAGITQVNEIAKWNGITWSAVGSGIDLLPYNNSYPGDIYSMIEYHNELYAGGEFMHIDSNNAKGIARYNGTIWNSVGSGVDSTGIITDTLMFPTDTIYIYAPHSVYAMLEYNNDLYVGGVFNMIGGISAKNIAKWSTPNSIPAILHKAFFDIYPNPLTSSSILQLNTQIKEAEVIVYDVLGKEMLRKKMNGNKMEIEKGSLEAGVYFVRVSTEERQWTQKLVIE